MTPITNNGHPMESVLLADLRPHPRNYKEHPLDQLEHIKESLREHGVYRNIVIARDNTILAGHGVWKAAQELGMESLPVIRLDVDPEDPRALKVLTGDNEIAHLGDRDDRLLSEILRDISQTDISGLLGTGYDELMLANLVFVTRPQSEIADHNEAAAWVGMPDYEPGEEPIKIIVSFRSMEDRAEFLRCLGLNLTPVQKSTWWPAKEREDLSSVIWTN